MEETIILAIVLNILPMIMGFVFNIEKETFYKGFTQVWFIQLFVGLLGGLYYLSIYLLGLL